VVEAALLIISIAVQAIAQWFSRLIFKAVRQTRLALIKGCFAAPIISLVALWEVVSDGFVAKTTNPLLLCAL